MGPAEDFEQGGVPAVGKKWKFLQPGKTATVKDGLGKQWADYAEIRVLGKPKSKE